MSTILILQNRFCGIELGFKSTSNMVSEQVRTYSSEFSWTFCFTRYLGPPTNFLSNTRWIYLNLRVSKIIIFCIFFFTDIRIKFLRWWNLSYESVLLTLPFIEIRLKELFPYNVFRQKYFFQSIIPLSNKI